MDPKTHVKFVKLYKEIDEIGTEIYKLYLNLSELAQKKL